MRGQKHRLQQQRGAAAVELAVVAPLLFLLLFALFEFGQGNLVVLALEDAANRGCREAICESGTPTSVADSVAAALAGTGIDDYQLAISPTSYPNVDGWEPVTVSVQVNFADVSWLPVPRWLGGTVLSGSSTLPRETGGLSTTSDWIGDVKHVPAGQGGGDDDDD